ncbi:Protein of unknown function [Cotesia congregata]|uniref:Uncharacterized protein n=1 Tax=Cotesia congregata TaxID=51543 RepID=A0A8J2H2W3_COTCN|nr:Protein of unknown function [Cotesia congregata]
MGNASSGRATTTFFIVSVNSPVKLVFPKRSLSFTSYISMIMGGCSFPDCHNSSEKGFKMLRFSHLVEMRSKWTTACKISKPITENSHILIPSPGKLFDVFETDDDNDDHYSVKSKRHKSGVSGSIVANVIKKYSN